MEVFFKLEFFELECNILVKISFVDFSLKISPKKPMKWENKQAV